MEKKKYKPKTKPVIMYKNKMWWILLQFNKYSSILISPTSGFCGSAVTKWKQQIILRKKNGAAVGLFTFFF